MRVPCLPNPPVGLSEAEEGITRRIAARRAENGLLPLDLVLLHAPEIANGWDILFSAIRDRSSLPDHIREIAICRTAVLNKAWYEWDWHAPILRNTERFAHNPNKIKTIADPNPTGPGELDAAEWAVLKFADEVTININPADDTFEKLRTICGLSNREIVELTATVSSYNFVSRFLVTLNIGDMNDKIPEENQWQKGESYSNVRLNHQ
ncbi:4-carboxymuconolactone decarboxylase [Fusarium phyllophilum]|uniref:4-carboxymuconolactone decarboxylase n=1 Tax=Fusarium phyllophilum TaxID=47803 RepID=A0A8H5I4Q4_9HYPO|nr:4-carboxymuconolactone decarboxylase [Fusarium phyllophilum]